MADLTETLGRAGLTLAEALEGEADLDALIRAVSRETVIRHAMAETGEGRTVVAEMLDATTSMGDEAVLDLMDGEPTTFRAAVQRYVEELEGRDELQPRDRVVDDLTTLLNYPWRDEEERLALHQANRALMFRVDRPDDEHVRVTIGDNAWELYSGSYDELGSSGMAAVENVAEAVYRAVLARVIPDRDHHVQLNSTDRRSLLAWLERPNGSWRPDTGNSRVTMDAVEGGGVLVRTRPYYFQHLPRTRV